MEVKKYTVIMTVRCMWGKDAEMNGRNRTVKKWTLLKLSIGIVSSK